MALPAWLSRLSIVIVTCNSACSLGEFLRHTDVDCRRRLIVVDNGSVDGTLELARRADLHTISLDGNKGFAQAANAGARAARGDHLCFINPDCRPSRRLFRAGSIALEKTPAACLSPEFQEEDGRKIPGLQPGYTWLKLLADVLATDYRFEGASRWLSRHSGFHDPDWSWPHGACFFMSRRRFLELGGFNEDYFLYMEDVDLGRRNTQRGGSVHLLPMSVFHASGKSCHGLGPMRREWLAKSRVRYAFEHHGRTLGSVLWVLTLPPRGYRKLRT